MTSANKNKFLSRSSILCLLSFFFLYSLDAQFVETVIAHPKIVDGMHIDSMGNIYTTSGGYTNGVEIGKYDIKSEQFDPFFSSGFFGPIDIDQYKDSLLVVTNYDNNTASSYNINTGEVKVIATGLDGPAGLAVDQEDNIYIT